MISVKSIDGVVSAFEDAMSLLRDSAGQKQPEPNAIMSPDSMIEPESQIVEKLDVSRSKHSPIRYHMTKRFHIYGQPVKSKKNGVGIAYEYWDWKRREHVILADKSKAKQCGNGTCAKVWVWYVDGEVSTKLTPEEIRLYCP